MIEFEKVLSNNGLRELLKNKDVLGEYVFKKDIGKDNMYCILWEIL